MRFFTFIKIINVSICLLSKKTNGNFLTFTKSHIKPIKHCHVYIFETKQKGKTKNEGATMGQNPPSKVVHEWPTPSRSGCGG
jgi:hypothetical protein